MKRRQILSRGIGLASLCCGGHAPAAAQVQPRIFGCVLSAPKAGSYLARSTEAKVFATGQEEIIPKSGDRDFDAALAQTLAHIAATFGVLPGFAYYEDDEANNAYATAVARLRNADGTVLFGTNLLKTVLSAQESPDVAVTAICAHEFGHILQMKQKLDKAFAGDASVKRLELQADFFAGYYAGLRRKSNPRYPAAVFALTQFNLGDEKVRSADHHGTPAERGDAVSRGFAASFTENLPVDAAIEAATRYAASIR